MSSTLSADDVTAVARIHLGPRVRCTRVARTPSGNSQETYFVTMSGVRSSEDATELVLRRSAAGGTLDWSDRGLEVAVLRAVHDAGRPVPTVWWWEPDGSPLDRAYAVMDRSPGESPNLRDAGVCTTLAVDLGRQIARLHVDACAPSELPVPSDSTASSAAQLAWWTDRARANVLTTDVAAALFGWLACNLPDDDTQPVLLWGDPGPHNVLTDQHGSITALLDWELAHIGHPLFDLGAARWSCLGHLERELLTVSYESELGATVDRGALAWFEVLACVTRSVMLFDGMTAILDGRSHDPNVLALGLSLVNANMLRAAGLAWATEAGGSPDSPHSSRVQAPDHEMSSPHIDTVVSRFLTNDVLPSIDDRRIRHGLKIASALLACEADATTSDRSDPWKYFERERDERARDAERQRLVNELAHDRQRRAALVDLYGATVAIANSE